jgi:hypothetical protein
MSESFFTADYFIILRKNYIKEDIIKTTIYLKI